MPFFSASYPSSVLAQTAQETPLGAERGKEMDGMRELAIDDRAICDLIHHSRNAGTNAEVALIARLAQVRLCCTNRLRGFIL